MQPAPRHKSRSLGLALVGEASPWDDTGALLKALREGNPSAQHYAWRRFSPLVRRLQSRLLGPKRDVADAAQETLIRFFQRVDRVRDGALLQSYLVGICYRVAREHRRAERVRSWFQLTRTGVVPELGFEPDVDGREALRRLDEALQHLSTDERALFVLRYMEGWELDDVARALGLSISTARRRALRGRSRVLALVRSDSELMRYLTAQEEDG